MWCGYFAVTREEIAYSQRFPLTMQQRLWPFQLRAILRWFLAFGFTLQQVENLLHAAARAVEQAKA